MRPKASPEPGKTPLLPYAILVGVLAAPFWLAGAGGQQLLGKRIPIDLPVTALAAMAPMSAALILLWRQEGPGGARRLLLKAVDAWKIRDIRWLLAALLLMPAIMGFEYGLLSITGHAVPDALFPIGVLPVFVPVFYLGAVGEELGWQGYGIAALQGRYSALHSALIIGLLWVGWHIIPFLQTHHTPSWVFWQCMQAFLARIIIVWLSANAGGSVFIAVLFHTMVNISEFMHPNYGSHYDPFVTSVILAVVAGLAIVLWGPKTLSEWRFARQSPQLSA